MSHPPRFPDDADVATLFAESLMNLEPWRLYDRGTYEAAPFVGELRDALRRALALDPRHPGANHLMVHVCEMSLAPEDALPSCAALLRVGKG